MILHFRLLEPESKLLGNETAGGSVLTQYSGLEHGVVLAAASKPRLRSMVPIATGSLIELFQSLQTPPDKVQMFEADLEQGR